MPDLSFIYLLFVCFLIKMLCLFQVFPHTYINTDYNGVLGPHSGKKIVHFEIKVKILTLKSK